ncbi:gluconate 2-dehydrogenase subunit 3 family protein [Sporosarcina sp.]|uniref:gluconate 2-dehydrogenase subunit 3 family protein n=1 Tax=Sporosarcina sp. TaxID=49982 RepID=UPI00261BC85E|nr:gluconate 2-dehydrogenase subunit 3 family protein [Sporosarcina sp.]
MSEQDKNQSKTFSRRNFLKNAGLTLGGLAVGSGVGSALTGGKVKEVEVEKIVENKANKALMYFTPEQFRVIDAASERIFPKDDNGPGAHELDVVYFIDHQLAGSWGTGAKEYRIGPFYKGEPTQGDQNQLNRQQTFENGIKGLQEHSNSIYQKNFEKLTEEEQDAILTDFSEDKVPLKGVSSLYFFNLLRSATLEGAYSDPLYGGNAGMEGWKMKNFPGHQMSMVESIKSDKFIKIEPMSLNSQHNH